MNIKTIADVLNSYFKSLNSVVRFEYYKDNSNGSIGIILIKDRFIESSILNMTDEFYDELENKLKEMGLDKPKYNNTGRIFY